MQKFLFRILSGATQAECEARYGDISPKDPYTFYLFDKGGIGYLGDSLLFGYDSHKYNFLSSNITATDLKANHIYFVTDNCTITDSTSTGANPDPGVKTAVAGSIWLTNGSKVATEISLNAFTTYMANYIASTAIHAAAIDTNYSGNETTLMTSAAIQALITRELSAQSILNISFFKNVSPAITVTETDRNRDYVIVTFDTIQYHVAIDNTVHVGDIGLVFQLQHGPNYEGHETDPGDSLIFINLHNLINDYVAGTNDTTVVTVQDKTGTNHTKEIKVEVNKSTKTTSEFETIVLDAINTVIEHMEDSANNPDYDATDSNGDNLSLNKFISEAQMANILAHVLVHFAQVVWGGGGSMEEEEEEIG